MSAPTVRTSLLIVVFLLSVFARLQAQPSETPPRVAAELSRLEEAKAEGARTYPIAFSPYNLFWRSKALELDEGEAERDARILNAVEEAGLVPMGVVPTWIFPPSVGARLTPPSAIASLSSVPEARIACVPDPDSSEYARMLKLRQRMFGRLARRFPGVVHWVVGYESDFPYFDCSGRQLDRESLIPFMADTLKNVREALRKANPAASVVAHFLGADGIPLYIRETLVQPSEIVAALAAEIDRRGDSEKDYYDFSITDFAPSLAQDRFPESTAIVPFGFSSPQGSLRAARSAPRDGDTVLNAGNWSTSPYWADYFSTAVSSLTGSTTSWNPWRTDLSKVYLKTVPVSGGKAHFVMGAPTGSEIHTSMGGATKPGVDVIPDEYFGSTSVTRNRWIAVMDFRPIEDPEPDGIHAAVFLRVNDRTWAGVPDQTRFGSIVWGGYFLGDPTCVNSYCGGLEIVGDNASNPSLGALKLFNFTISEYPWNSPTHTYRVQILEEERYDPFLHWRTWWQAQVVDLTDSQTIGSSAWYQDYVLENTYGIDKPGLTGSKLEIGFGPGLYPWEGSFDADLAGTAYWIY